MPIRINIEGMGTVATFPDGTDDKVIKDTVKKIIAEKTPAPPLTASSLEKSYKEFMPTGAPKPLPAATKIDRAVPPGFTERVWTDWKQRGAAIGDIAKDPRYTMQPITAPSEQQLRIAGEVAKGIGQTIGEAGTSAYRTLMPEEGQEVVRAAAQHPKEIFQGLAQVSPAHLPLGVSGALWGLGAEAYRKGGALWDLFAKAHPNIAKDLEAGVNIALLYPGMKVGEAGVGAAGTLKRPLTETALDAKIGWTVRSSLEKAGIAPKGKLRSTKLASGYFDKARQGVETIIQAKPLMEYIDPEGLVSRGRLPETLWEYSQAIGTAKGKLVEIFDAMDRQANRAGARIDNLEPIAQGMDAIAKNVVKQDWSPSLVAYAQKKAKVLRDRQKLGGYSVVEAQELIRDINAKNNAYFLKLKAGLAGPAHISVNHIDELMAQTMRVMLDDAITQYVAPGYQEIKNLWGSLTSMEADVSGRAAVYARRAPKGLIDLTDIFTLPSAVKSLLTKRPALLAGDILARGVKEYYKLMNSPNRRIRNMFREVEDLMGQRARLRGPGVPPGAAPAARPNLPGLPGPGAPAPMGALPAPRPGFTMRTPGPPISGPGQNALTGPPAPRALPSPQGFTMRPTPPTTIRRPYPESTGQMVGEYPEVVMKGAKNNILGGDLEVAARIKGDIQAAKAGKRTPLPDGTWTGQGSTWPDYLKGGGYTAKHLNRIIDKALAGEKLTELERRNFNTVVKAKIAEEEQMIAVMNKNALAAPMKEIPTTGGRARGILDILRDKGGYVSLEGKALTDKLDKIAAIHYGKDYNELGPVTQERVRELAGLKTVETAADKLEGKIDLLEDRISEAMSADVPNEGLIAKLEKQRDKLIADFNAIDVNALRDR